MPAFNDLSAAFFDEYFRLDPVSATGIGDHRFDDRWPDLSSAGRAARIAFAERWIATPRGSCAGRPERRRAGRSRGPAADPRGDPLPGHGAARRALGPAHLGVHPGRRHLPAALPRVRAAGDAPGLGRRAPRRAARDRGCGAGRARRAQATGPSPGSTRRSPSSSWPASASSSDEALAAAEAAPDDAAVRAIEPRLREAAATAPGRPDRVRSAPPGRGPAGVGGGGPAGRGALHGQAPPHAPGGPEPGRCPRPCRARLRGGPRRDAAARARPVADLAAGSAQPTAARPGARRRPTRRPCAPSSTRSPPTTLRRTGSSTTAAPRSAGSRRSAATTRSSAWPTSRSRSAGRPSSCGPSAGRCSTRPVRSTGTRSRSSASRPSPRTGPPNSGELPPRAERARPPALTIHEAVPGHYLQGTYANRNPSLPRTVLWSGVFAEGWAVYVTQVMMDLGYGATIRAPARPLEVLHAGDHERDHGRPDPHVGMTEDEAMELMVVGGFQEDAEARTSDRARLTSTQLSTYFVGSSLFWEIELEARRRAALASGDQRGAAAVPEPRVVGAIGDTPGFRYREHLERVIGHGFAAHAGPARAALRGLSRWSAAAGGRARLLHRRPSSRGLLRGPSSRSPLRRTAARPVQPRQPAVQRVARLGRGADHPIQGRRRWRRVAALGRGEREGPGGQRREGLGAEPGRAAGVVHAEECPQVVVREPARGDRGRDARSRLRPARSRPPPWEPRPRRGSRSSSHVRWTASGASVRPAAPRMRSRAGPRAAGRVNQARGRGPHVGRVAEPAQRGDDRPCPHGRPRRRVGQGLGRRRDRPPGRSPAPAGASVAVAERAARPGLAPRPTRPVDGGEPPLDRHR